MKISQLTLYTQNLVRQKAFYEQTLGVTLTGETPTSVDLLLGKTVLTFIEKTDATPYHFAINIPSDCTQEALTWLKERVAILTDQDQEVQEFKAWNAQSIYFYDPDKNIVEFIARRNLGYGSYEPFSAASFVEISEIGMAVSHIAPYYNRLNRAAGLGLFDGNLKQFSAIGDEYGLFICINKLLKSWYPTGDKAYASGFELSFTENSRNFSVRFRDEILNIKATS